MSKRDVVVVETADGEWAVLVNGVQWAPPIVYPGAVTKRLHSGAYATTFSSETAAWAAYNKHVKAAAEGSRNERARETATGASTRSGVTVGDMRTLVNEVEALNTSVDENTGRIRALIYELHKGSITPGPAAAKLQDIAANLGCGLGRSTYVLGILQHIQGNHPELYRGHTLLETVTDVLNEDLAAVNIVSQQLRGLRTSGLGASKSKPKVATRATFQQRRGAALEFERLLVVGSELMAAVSEELRAVIDGAFDTVPAEPVVAAWIYAHASLCHADRILHDISIPAALIADLQAMDAVTGEVRKQLWPRVAVMPIEPRSTVERPRGRPTLTVVRGVRR